MARQRPSSRSAPTRYDFRAGGGQPRPHLRTLVRMHEVMVEKLVGSLSRLLRCEVDVEVAATELATFEEYVRSMPMVTVVSTFKMHPLEGRCAVELNPQLATVMVERMLGGPGTGPQLRRLTEIEAAVLGELVDELNEGIGLTYAPLLDLQSRFDGLVFDPEFLDIAEAQDTVVLIAYRVSLRAEEGITEGIFTICYPNTTLAPVLRQLQDADLSGLDENAPRPVGPLVQHLPDVAVPVSLVLNPTEMAARDLADLAPGDVLRLDHRLEEPATAWAGGSELFRGNLGQRRRRLAVQVSTVRKLDDHTTAAAAGAPGLPAGTAPDPTTQPVPASPADVEASQ